MIIEPCDKRKSRQKYTCFFCYIPLCVHRRLHFARLLDYLYPCPRAPPRARLRFFKERGISCFHASRPCCWPSRSAFPPFRRKTGTPGWSTAPESRAKSFPAAENPADSGVLPEEPISLTPFAPRGATPSTSRAATLSFTRSSICRAGTNAPGCARGPR